LPLFSTFLFPRVVVRRDERLFAVVRRFSCHVELFVTFDPAALLTICLLLVKMLATPITHGLRNELIQERNL